MTEYHESWDALPERVKDHHRALKSLQEELEAVDWYNQRVAMTSDESLRDVLTHNRDEEIEHAVMVLEWLRRNMDAWDENLREFMFSEGPLTHDHDDHADHDGIATDSSNGSLGLGKLG